MTETKFSFADISLQRWLLLVAIVAVVACVTALLLWQRLGSIQEQLARQSAESSANAMEARNTARLAQDTAMQTAAKLAVTDARLDEIGLQRSQLEALMQSLSRSRDDNLLMDIESSVRLAQQQAQLSGSLEPLLAALKSAEVRLSRVAQPRWSPVQRAIAADIARLNNSSMADTPALLRRLDALLAMVTSVNWAHSASTPAPLLPLKKQADESVPDWWQRVRQAFWEEARGLVRVSKITSPDAALVAPEQSFFLQQNLQLILLNARLGLLARQTDSASADVVAAATLLQKYADASAKKNKAMIDQLVQVAGQIKQLELPQVDDTLAAINQAGAGR